MSTLPQHAGKTAELEAEVERLRESLATLAGAEGETRKNVATLLRCLRIAEAEVEEPYDRAAASTRHRKDRIAALGLRLVGDGG